MNPIALHRTGSGDPDRTFWANVSCSTERPLVHDDSIIADTAASQEPTGLWSAFLYAYSQHDITVLKALEYVHALYQPTKDRMLTIKMRLRGIGYEEL